MTESELEVRRAKRDELRRGGTDPYPPRFSRRESCARCRELIDTDAGKDVRTAGRVRAIRGHGKSTFATIEDESGDVQVYLKKDVLGGAYDLLKQIDLGDFVGVSGEMFRTKMGEVTVMVKELAFLSKAIEPLPSKWHGLEDVEIRYRQRYLDLIANPGVRDVFRRRARIVSAIRAFLSGEGFMEVETPMMQPLAGGAAARPFITHHNALDIDLYLRVAPELYLKRLLVGGFEKVFEINRNFRNEGIDRFHNPEFTMMELYEAYADFGRMMDLTERMVEAAAVAVNGSTSLMWPAASEGVTSQSIEVKAPWERIAYFDAIEKFGGPRLEPGDAVAAAAAGSGLCRKQPARPEPVEGRAADSPPLMVRQAHHERWHDSPDQPSYAECLDALFEHFVEPHLSGPVFITDYPTILSPLAKRRPDNPHLVERFEAYIAGMEIANAFSELNDPDDQEARFLEQAGGRPDAVDMDFVHALRAGMPPAGGLGVGIDRLVMILTGAASIRDVIFFPTLRRKMNDER